MKKFNKNSKMALVSISFVLGLFVPVSVFAASTPALGFTATYGVLGSTYTNTVPGTTVTGDIGFTTPPAVAPAGVHTNYGSGAPYATAGVDQGNLLSALNAQACTFTFPDTDIDLATDVSHGAIGVYTPGVYCTRATRAASIGTAGITLNGSGTYIFRVNGALTSVDNSVVTLAGASACDVFWTPTSATTLGANTTFIGTIIDDADITIGAVTTWLGRALSFGGTVTTSVDDIITVPSCVVPPVPPTPTSDIGGVFSMPWVMPLISVLKVPTPLALPSGPGLVTYDYAVSNIGSVEMNNITVTDDKCFPVVYVSGDTNGDSKLARGATWKYRCSTTLLQTTTNTVTAKGHAYFFTAVDTANATVVVGASTTPPLIHIVKIPSVTTLPVSGGEVTYSYTITNPGTVPLSNVSVSDDKCTGLPGRVIGHPGDINNNNLLESNESWSFTCKSYLTKTTTNTATAIGYANGLSATDFALATVVVPQVLGVSAGFPNTGLPPEERSIPWNSILLVIGAFVISAFIPAKKDLMF